MVAPQIFICSASRQQWSTSAHFATQLSVDLSNAGAEIVTDLARCDWVLLLQSHELLQSAVTRALVQQALKYNRQGRLRGIIRILVETDPSQRIPSEWVALPTVEGQRYEETLKALKERMGLGSSLLDTFFTGASGPLQTPASIDFTQRWQTPGSPTLPAGTGPLPPVSPAAERLGKARYWQLPSNPVLPTVPTNTTPLPPLSPAAERLEAARYWQSPGSSVPPTSTSPLPPFSPAGKWLGKTRWWLVASVFGLTGLILSTLLFISWHAAAPPAAPRTAGKAIGTASLYSSNMLNPEGTSGINDGVQIDLSLPQPGPGESYFAWLLPDPANTEGEVVFLGKLTLQSGQAHLQYMDASHRDLLGWTSRFLVTEENGSVVPYMPSLDQRAWKYFAEFPQRPDTMDTMGHYSLLDHLRHLLVEQPDLQKKGLHGGLALWLRQNTEKVLELATAARGTGVPQSPSLMHRQFVRILDYIDGTPYVQADVPPGTPPLVDPAIGQIGLLTLDPQAVPPGYISHIEMHLEGLIGSPGANTGQRQLAARLDQSLTVIKGDLEGVRKDAVKLVALPLDQLNGSDSIALLNDLVEKSNEAYVGRYDPDTGIRQGGVTFVYDQLQHLATFEVLPYRP